MSTLAQRRMTVDEFLAWAEGREGRWELYNGVPFACLRSGRLISRSSMRFTSLCRQAIRKAGLPCHVQGDGASIRISQHLMYGPDALVYCGPKLPDDALEAPNPVILVEVASPSTRKMDETVKLNGYFSLPSVHHYLIVDPDGPPVVHYSRQADGTPVQVGRARGHPDAVAAGDRGGGGGAVRGGIAGSNGAARLPRRGRPATTTAQARQVGDRE